MDNNIELMRQIGAGIAIAIQKSDMTDTEALSTKDIQKPWKSGEEVKPGNRRTYDDKLYKVRDGQGHTTQDDWTPDKTPTMWEVIDEQHAGTQEDPIPWSTGMHPEEGKYYVEGDLLAKCIEDPLTTLYGTLSSLCPGRYFE